MKIKSIFFLIISVVFTQNDISFSLKSKFAKDKNSSINSPTYLENLLDASMYFNDVYLYAQLEYSNPPLMGVNKKKLSDLLNVLYFEISKDKYDFKFGNLYTVRGSGLSFNTYADQDIDYDKKEKTMLNLFLSSVLEQFAGFHHYKNNQLQLRNLIYI